MVDAKGREMLERAIEAVTIDNRFAADAGIAAKVFLDLSVELQHMLDEDQRFALQCSQRSMLDPSKEVERLKGLEIACRIMDRYFDTSDIDTKLESVNRLLFASLVRHEGFDFSAADLAIDHAAHAGIDLRTIAQIFERHVPGFENPFR